MHTYSDQFIFSTGSQVPSIRTEAHAPNVEVAHRVDRIILQDADLLAGDDIEDLSRSVAACCNILAVVAESDTAYHTLMLKGVDEVDVEHTWDTRVENGKPIGLDLLLMRGQSLEIQLG